MKTRMTNLLALFLALGCLLALAGCGAEKADTEGLWADAMYLSDEEFGEGGKTVTVEVTAEEKTVTFTIHTDAETVGDALLEHGLITGETMEVGLYLQTVNGIAADYDTDGSYWAFYLDGDYAMNGIDTEPVAEGTLYQLVRTK